MKRTDKDSKCYDAAIEEHRFRNMDPGKVGAEKDEDQ